MRGAWSSCTVYVNCESIRKKDIERKLSVSELPCHVMATSFNHWDIVASLIHQNRWLVYLSFVSFILMVHILHSCCRHCSRMTHVIMLLLKFSSSQFFSQQEHEFTVGVNLSIVIDVSGFVKLQVDCKALRGKYNTKIRTELHFYRTKLQQCYLYKI